jgi:hypothetical protein
MSKESNLVGMQRFAEAVNTGNFSLLYDAVAPGAIDHDPAPGQGTGPGGLLAVSKVCKLYGNAIISLRAQVKFALVLNSPYFWSHAPD